MNEDFHPESNLFGPITLQSQSDWITSHSEYLPKIQKVYQCSLQRNIIFIHSPLEVEGTPELSEYVKELKGYSEAFFYSLTIKLLGIVSCFCNLVFLYIH